MSEPTNIIIATTKAYSLFSHKIAVTEPCGNSPIYRMMSMVKIIVEANNKIFHFHFNEHPMRLQCLTHFL